MGLIRSSTAAAAPEEDESARESLETGSSKLNNMMAHRILQSYNFWFKVILSFGTGSELIFGGKCWKTQGAVVWVRVRKHVLKT